jgi:flagellar motor switch protein FliM
MSTEKKEGKRDGERLGGSQRVKPHDFGKPRLLSQERVRALDLVHRKFGEAASTVLSVLARAKAHVELAGIHQCSYFDFIRSLPSPTCMHLVNCLPQKAPLVFEMELQVLFLLIERLLGGRGEATPRPRRPLTRIEQGLARSIAEKLLAPLRDVWSACLLPAEAPKSAQPGLRFDIAENEHNPLLMQVVGPAEPALVLAFQVNILSTAGARAGEAEGRQPIDDTRPRATGLFHACLPVKPFEAILARLSQGGSGALLEPNTADERERILRSVAGAEVTVSAELGSVPFALSDILSLRPGDVIDTQIQRGAEVTMRVEGRRVGFGHAATHEGKRAVKVTRCEAEADATNRHN